jgi:hypothetical protein
VGPKVPKMSRVENPSRTSIHCVPKFRLFFAVSAGFGIEARSHSVIRYVETKALRRSRPVPERGPSRRAAGRR